jgi:hypothetical protein
MKSFGTLVRDWWVGKGCVQHSDRLKAYADRLFESRMKRAIAQNNAKWERVLRAYVGERMFDNIVIDFDEGTYEESI